MGCIFLDQQTQKVVIRGTESQPFAVMSGVPQGSVLGPIFFLIFINNLPIGFLSHVSLFTDDSKLFTKIVGNSNKDNDSHNGIEALQRDLNCVRDWAFRWNIKFNVDKCKIMHLGYKLQAHIYNGRY